MIKFTLCCDQDHSFEAWFDSSDAFEEQKTRGFVSCPVCGNQKVQKALMAPNVSTARKKDEMQVATVNQMAGEVMEKMREVRDLIHANSEDMGDKFVDEARKIHYGEAEERGIRGKASVEDAAELTEEGIGIAPIPVLPDEAN